MQTSHDVQYFLGELERLFDSDRNYHEIGEDAFVDELEKYFSTLNSEEQALLGQAVLNWLRSGDEVRQWQSIRLCGEWRLLNCVDDLIILGESLRHQSPASNDMNWIIQSLGQIGSTKALDFLMQEVAGGEFQIDALMAISRIDISRALPLMVSVIQKNYGTGLDPIGVERLLRAFLFSFQDEKIKQLGIALSNFPDKAYLLQQYYKAQATVEYGANGKYMTRRKKRRLLKFFKEGLQGPNHPTT